MSPISPFSPAIQNFYAGMAAGCIDNSVLAAGGPFLQPAIHALQLVAPNPATMPPHQVRLAADLVRESGERTSRLFQSPEEVLAAARRAVGYRPSPPKPDFPKLHLPPFSHWGFRKAVKGLYNIVERDGRPLPSIWIDLFDAVITRPFHPEPSEGHFRDSKTGEIENYTFYPPELPDRSSEKFNGIMTAFARDQIPHLSPEGAGEFFRFLLVLLGRDYIEMGFAEMITKKILELIKSTAEEGRREMVRMAIDQAQGANSFVRLINTSWLLANLLYLNMCEDTCENLIRDGMVEILRAMHCADHGLARSIFFPVLPLSGSLSWKELKSVVELLFPGIYSERSVFKRETAWVERKMAEGTFPPMWMESYHASMTIDILLMGLTSNEALLLFEESILPLLKGSSWWFQKGGKPTLQDFRDWLKTKYDLNPKKIPFHLAGLARYNPELFPEYQ